MGVRGTERGIIIVVAGVAASVLMITGGVAETGICILIVNVFLYRIILYVRF
jgi:hypothetical protein